MVSARLLVLLGGVLGVLITHPALAVALLGLLGTLAVAAAGQPVVWAFVAGVFARPRITRRWSR